MTDLNKEELLQELAYLDQAEYIDKQIYAQLVKIVEQYYSEPDSDTQEELLATWEQLYDFFDEHHNLYTNDIGKRLREKCIRIKQLLTQKPQKQSGEVEE